MKPQNHKFWEKRDIKDHQDWNYKAKNWPEGYWVSKIHPHRALTMEAIAQFKPFSSLLEVGCSCGPNLSCIWENFPDTTLAGIDVSKLVIQEGVKRFKNAVFLEGEANKLPFPDKSFDIILCDAVLMYISPGKIRKTIKEFLRVARKGLVFVEWHLNDEISLEARYGEIKYYHWARNYIELLKEFDLEAKAEKIPPKIWPTGSGNWGKLGYIITAKIK